ncbi:MAG: hypothetical protein ACFCVH_10675 [Alphaproteobacteria bacterium]
MTFVLGSTIITVMACADRADAHRPLADALDDPWPALWTILGSIAAAVLVGVGGGLSV